MFAMTLETEDDEWAWLDAWLTSAVADLVLIESCARGRIGGGGGGGGGEGEAIVATT